MAIIHKVAIRKKFSRNIVADEMTAGSVYRVYYVNIHIYIRPTRHNASTQWNSPAWASLFAAQAMHQRDEVSHLSNWLAYWAFQTPPTSLTCSGYLIRAWTVTVDLVITVYIAYLLHIKANRTDSHSTRALVTLRYRSVLKKRAIQTLEHNNHLLSSLMRLALPHPIMTRRLSSETLSMSKSICCNRNAKVWKTQACNIQPTYITLLIHEEEFSKRRIENGTLKLNESCIVL